jgi:putative inorganic carbon (HCO3(-)) transporter
MQKNILNKTSGTVLGWFRDQILTKKLASPLGILLLACLSVVMAYATVLVSVKLSIGITAMVGAILLCALSVLYPVLGFSLSFFVCFFLLIPARMTNVPIVIPTGLIPEYFSYLTLLGLLGRQEYRKEITAEFWNSPIIWWSLVMMAYYCLILFNPAMTSKVGWFNFTRKQLSYTIFIMITFMMMNSHKSLVFVMRSWIVVSTIHALYCCKQQWFGFAQFEYIWLISDPKRFDLFVNSGFVRRFGLVSDPAAAGILYACGCVLVLVLGLRAKEFRKKIIYFILAVIHFLASSYTGTRTATLMIIAGMAFYCILTLYEKRTLIFSGVFGLGLMALMFAPIYDNMVINRLRSTFEGSKDPSAMARDMNRKMVQPYVWSHPIGGGLNTAGLVGQTYNPGHYLSMIPPDSAYMQTMMEQGPIGLALLLIFYYIIMRTGIKYFYRVKDHYIKTLYVANLVSIFTLLVAQFSQQAIGQYPSVLYFYVGLALLMKLHQFDGKEKTEATEH